LLNKIPEARNNGSYTALKVHPWFEDFDWDGLLNETLEPPYKPPKLKNITDNEIEQMAQENIIISNYIKEKYQDEIVR